VTQSVAIIGGTGPEGKGLAARLAIAGYEVIIGSRSADRAFEAAGEIGTLTSRSLKGAPNEDAAASGDFVILTVPYSGLTDTLPPLAEAIGEKVVVSTVVPLQFANRRVSMLDLEAGSAAQEVQALLPRAKVVGAFHNLGAGHLVDITHHLEGDVVVCSDDAEATQAVIEMTNSIQALRGVNGGPLAVSRYVEGITAMLVSINRLHKAETNIKIVGLDGHY
jgi:NADPH-dependent F420 reductase